MDQLSGNVAVITGGASGIGLATARQLATEGMRIVLADIEPAALDRAVDEVQTLGADVLGVRTDVGDLTSVQRLADAAYDRFGNVHIVFNNAGVAVGGPTWEMSHADWEWLMRVNLWGPIHGVEVFTKRMVDAGEGGHVLFTASFAGLVPNVGLGVYCVTKYGVVAMAEVLQKELRPHGIGVSVLCPMRVQTNIGNSERNRPAAFGGPEASPTVPDQGDDNTDLSGNVLPVEAVAKRVVQAIKRNELYILPHPESRAFIRNRFERIDRTFSH
jgi:NAD(P)-dependent dehydrogenase (short-subunit alcohol dehydrogenase family)